MGHSVARRVHGLFGELSNVQTLAEEKGKGCNAVKSAPSSHLWTTVHAAAAARNATAAAAAATNQDYPLLYCVYFSTTT